MREEIKKVNTVSSKRQVVICLKVACQQHQQSVLCWTDLHHALLEREPKRQVFASHAEELFVGLVEPLRYAHGSFNGS